MKLVIQRVSKAWVKNLSSGQSREIQKGVVVFVGFSKDDSETVIARAVDRILGLRIFPEEGEKGDFSISVKEGNFEILVVPEFTLYGNIKKGRRPDFGEAKNFNEAKSLYEKFLEELKKHTEFKSGWFGAMQEVAIFNFGPVTLIYEK
ncbi:MAG: D-tyrosyl-tRNA(Tyr) deacylase [Elusimicrobia bacterium]|nr:D-tyrosyl-tRNA(Tyr) deacylase [Elusimicrobiota bacterium]